MHSDLPVGKYVLLSVADTGCGMDQATQNRIFEPFFTTKPVGKGTGLGLAMVYGVMKASGGHAAVESEPGRGTTFHLFIPAVHEPGDVVVAPSRHENPAGKETVLLVEDEIGVRTLARQALEAGGYRVLEAADGEVALHLCRQHGKDIDLLLSDVVMPEMGGRELHRQVRAIYRAKSCSLPATRRMRSSSMASTKRCRLSAKPFSVNALLQGRGCSIGHQPAAAWLEGPDIS